jgi:hypothetical protein
VKIKTYQKLKFDLLLWFEVWCVTLKGEHNLIASENRMLKRISGNGRQEVTAEWRKMYNEELHNF